MEFTSNTRLFSWPFSFLLPIRFLVCLYLCGATGSLFAGDTKETLGTNGTERSGKATGGIQPDILVDQNQVRCYSEEDDLDRDGYAATGASAVLFGWTGEKMHPCPYGYLPFAGDCNDRDANTHPFLEESAFNLKDDNCNGLVDEARFHPYKVSRSNRLVWSLQSAKQAKLFAAGKNTVWVESQILGQSQTLRYPLKARVGKTANEYAVYLPMHSKDVGKIHRSRFLHSNLATPSSDWHYWYFPAGPSPEEQKRARVLESAFYEFSLSQAGKTGYAGDAPDGFRYGAWYGFWWCSEFYSFVAGGYHTALKNIRTVRSMKRAFRNSTMDKSGTKRSRLAKLQDPKYILQRARPGDYLAVTIGDRSVHNHSTMVLAAEVQQSNPTGYVWLLEGNYFDKVVIKRRKVIKSKNHLGELSSLPQEVSFGKAVRMGAWLEPLLEASVAGQQAL